MKANQSASDRSTGMTLLELLAVICLMALLIGLGAPAISSMLRGGELAQSAQLVADQMALARQMALSSNRQIEVRLYRFVDSKMTGESASQVRAIQLFEVPEAAAAGGGKSGYRAVSRFVRLPGPSVIIDSGSALSTLIGNAAGGGAVPTLASGSELGFPIPAAGTSYEAICFSFLPDGSTNLPPQTGQLRWFLTLHEAQRGDGLTTPPPNFATLQIQPSNGKLLSYHP